MHLKLAGRVGGLMVMGALAFGALGVTAQDEGKILITGRQMGSSDIPTLDPSLAEDVPSVQVIWELFPELVRVNEETAALQPGMAEYAASEDGTVYTFNILPDVAWVQYNAETGEVEQALDEDGNVRTVTAQDFAYGITRTIDPRNAATYQFVLTPWITGATEAGALGESTDEEIDAALAGLGINVVDDLTLEITVPVSSTVTPYIFGLWVTAAQPSWVIEEQAEFWIDPEYIQTYGPFALKEWVRGDGGSLTMIRNPFWAGTDAIPAPALDEVQFRFLDEEVQLTEFEAGTLDVAEAPASASERILSDEALSAQYFQGPGTCTYYYGFNTERAPFDDARVRQAFSMAIDREAITTNVLGAGEQPADLFALPSLNAAPNTEMFSDIGIESDNEGAVALFDEYTTEMGTTAADYSLTLFHNESALHSSIAQAVQAMWNETLGVSVEIATADFATYLETRGEYDVYRAAWCFDYPDSHNYYYDAGFHSDLLAENDTHWSNADYDALVDEAFTLEDVAARAELYAQADDILVNQEAAIAPIYFYVTNDLTAPYVTRTNSLITREAYEKWDINR